MEKDGKDFENTSMNKKAKSKLASVLIAIIGIIVGSVAFAATAFEKYFKISFVIADFSYLSEKFSINIFSTVITIIAAALGVISARVGIKLIVDDMLKKARNNEAFFRNLNRTSVAVIRITSALLGYSTFIILDKKDESEAKRSLTASDDYLEEETKKARTGVILVALGTFSYIILTNLFGIREHDFWYEIVAGAVVASLMIIRVFVISYRIEQGYFGYNAMEAGQLAKFIIKNQHKDGGGGGGKWKSALRSPSKQFDKSGIGLASPKPASFREGVQI